MDQGRSDELDVVIFEDSHIFTEKVSDSRPQQLSVESHSGPFAPRIGPGWTGSNHRRHDSSPHSVRRIIVFVLLATGWCSPARPTYVLFAAIISECSLRGTLSAAWVLN